MQQYSVEFRDSAGDWHCLGTRLSVVAALQVALQCAERYPYAVRVLAGQDLIWESEGK